MDYMLGFMSGIVFIFMLAIISDRIQTKTAVTRKQIGDYDDHGQAGPIGQ